MSAGGNPTAVSPRHTSLLALPGGWGWAGLLRFGIALTIAVHALAPSAPTDALRHPQARPVTLLVAAVLLGLSLAQGLSRFRSSRLVAVLLLAVDVLAVLGVLALHPSPRRYLPALIVVVQAEAGVVLGLPDGTLAWLLTTGGYLAIEGMAVSVTGAAPHAATVAIRLGVGLLLNLVGGVMAEELSGERARRFEEQRRELGRVREAADRYRQIVEQTPVVTYVASTGELGNLLYVSPQLEAMLGYSPESWVRDPHAWARSILAEDRGWVAAERARTRRTGEPFKAEYRVRARDGRTLWVRDEAAVPEAPGETLAWQGILVDITERKRAEERVAYLAYHDGLTGLPNRRMFEELAELALARARRHGLGVAVLYLDLDRFKEVNDTLGHAAGDELLAKLAGRLRSAVRDTDVMVRFGGDEFVILLADLELTPDAEGTPHAQRVAEAVARRTHEHLRRPFEVGGREVAVAASIGISVYPLWSRDVKSLLKQADEAMYRSKRAGGSERTSLPPRAVRSRERRSRR